MAKYSDGGKVNCCVLEPATVGEVTGEVGKLGRLINSGASNFSLAMFCCFCDWIGVRGALLSLPCNGANCCGKVCTVPRSFELTKFASVGIERVLVVSVSGTVSGENVWVCPAANPGNCCG